MSAVVARSDFPHSVPAVQLSWRNVPLQFTGSGSEYFRIWIVNLLLVVLTLSLYLPFARARRLRYFHGNTWVGGHALGFHGQGWVMLRGHLLVLAFAACYAVAGHVSPLAAGVAGLALVGLAPALWQASLRFRLAHTSWRGLRMRFDGRLLDAYRAVAPVLLPAGVFVGVQALRPPPGEAGGPALLPMADWADAVSALCLLCGAAMAPWLLHRLKRYQHGHYHLAGDTTTLHARAGDFYRLWVRGSGVALLPFVLLVLLAGLVGLMTPVDAGLLGEDGPAAWQLVGAVVLALLFYGSMAVLVQSWYTARLQNLVWGRTASPRLHFSARLAARALAWLTLKNLLLTLLTLGLYRPFAVVATTRLRLHALQLEVLGPVDDWVAGPHGRADNAAGDAADDLLGVDLGL